MSRHKFYHYVHADRRGREPAEIVPRTDHEETRRAARDWLRDRDETNVNEFWVDDDQWDGE